MSDITNQKPCPFCNGSPHLMRASGTTYFIVCGACGAQTDECSEADEAWALWNARVDK